MRGTAPTPVVRAPLIRTLALGLVLAFPGSLLADAGDWLMKINEASAKTNFHGTFVYIHGDSVEAMEVTRRIDSAGMMEERLYSLNGEPREVIRSMNKVWCYIPDQNVVVHDYRQASESGFPRLLPSDLTGLLEFYDFEMGEPARIANREAVGIRVVPRDAYRYGYNLWADADSGLLLRSDLVTPDQQIVEQYLFVSVEIGGDIPDRMLAPVNDTGEMQLFGNTGPVSAPVDDSRWTLTNLPEGFKLTRHFRRMSPMDAGEVEHMVFTDGLSSFSVFIKAASDRQSTMEGLSRMGAVHAFRRNVSDYRVTVMGEVPAMTVEYLASGVLLASQ